VQTFDSDGVAIAYMEAGEGPPMLFIHGFGSNHAVNWVSTSDHLGVGEADVLGYSMGARIAAFLALAYPERVRRVVLSGLGEGLVRQIGDPQAIAAALRAPTVDAVAEPVARAYRVFADQTGSDREALAACILAPDQWLSADELARIRVPVLVAVGSEDTAAGSAAGLAAMIPGARAFEIAGRDHMKAVGDRTHKAAVLAFFAEKE
jgi:pimeloyl-ACP methyl ester carboxylesterase